MSDLSHTYNFGPYTIRDYGPRFFVGLTGTNSVGKSHRTRRHALNRTNFFGGLLA